MASEEKKRTLLALAPLLLHPPPIIQTTQLLYGTADLSLISAGTASVAALAIMDINNKPKERPPHPQQGGHRITAQYLEELSDTEAQWTFRYAP